MKFLLLKKKKKMDNIVVWPLSVESEALSTACNFTS